MKTIITFENNYIEYRKQDGIELLTKYYYPLIEEIGGIGCYWLMYPESMSSENNMLYFISSKITEAHDYGNAVMIIHTRSSFVIDVFRVLIKEGFLRDNGIEFVANMCDAPDTILELKLDEQGLYVNDTYIPQDTWMSLLLRLLN